jgi:hypothetical protein
MTPLSEHQSGRNPSKTFHRPLTQGPGTAKYVARDRDVSGAFWGEQIGEQVGARPEQPEPFLRGCLYPGLSDAAYPRANPTDSEHLPTDVWHAAQVPAGVRLEFVGEVDAVRIFYRTTTANLGYRGDGAGCTFSLYRAGQKIAEEDAVLGEGVVQLPLYGEPGRPAIVYLPEGMKPIVSGIEGIGGPIEPAPRQPRWLSYGEAVTQGWLASSPAMAWPAVTARKLGLDLCNFGYAGSTRADTATALAIAETPAEIVTISIGANIWSRFPHTPALCVEEVRAMLTLVRAGHPQTPIVVVSPLVRPEAEDTPNQLGSTLTELRIAIEEAVRERMISGDVRLHLVEGSTVVGVADLADGRYPGDDGHIRIAAAVGKVISPLVAELRDRAEARWEAERQAANPVEMPPLPSTDFLRQVGTVEVHRAPAAAPHMVPANASFVAPPAAPVSSGVPHGQARVPVPVQAARLPEHVHALAHAPAHAYVASHVPAAQMPGPVPSAAAPMQAQAQAQAAQAQAAAATYQDAGAPLAGYSAPGHDQYAASEEDGYVPSSSDRYATLQPASQQAPQPTGYPYGVPPDPPGAGANPYGYADSPREQ